MAGARLSRSGALAASGFALASVLALCTATSDYGLDAADEAASRVYDAITEHEESVYIADLELTYAEASDAVRDLLDDHLEIFYLKGNLLPESNGVVESVELSYRWDEDETKRRVDEYESAADDALGLVSANMDDAHKAKALHDWLVWRCSYGYARNAASHLDAAHYAWGPMVAGAGVCDGYSDAYRDLLVRVGIESRSVRSSEIGREWTQVLIDGSWYHVDCCWDDPIVIGDKDRQHLGWDPIDGNFLMSEGGAL